MVINNYLILLLTTRLAAEALPLEWLADLTLLVGTRLGDVDDANHGGDAQENCDGAEDGGGDFQLYPRLTAVETEGAACLGASLDFEGIPTTRVIVTYDSGLIEPRCLFSGVSGEAQHGGYQHRHQERHPGALGLHVLFLLVLLPS